LMKAQAIVPHDEHPDLPAQAAGEGGLRDVLDEELQDRRGLSIVRGSAARAWATVLSPLIDTVVLPAPS